MKQTDNFGRNKILYSVVAVVLLLWGLAGLQDITKTPYSGYNLSPDRVVTDVRAGSPAEAAGMLVGDKITKLDGIEMENNAALAQRGRSSIGSTAAITINRGGLEQTLNLTYAEQSLTDMILNEGAGILVGLASLILGLMIYFRNPTRLSTMLCLLMMGLAALFLPGPYMQSVTARGWLGALFAIITGLWVALLLEYCLSFPNTKKILANRPWLNGFIMVMALIPALVIAYLNLARPNISDSLSSGLNLLFGVVFGGIFLCSLWAIVNSYMKADATERKAWGLNWMMIGVVIGLLPLVLSIAMRLFIPRLATQGWERMIGLFFLAIPICFSLALMKREPAREAAYEEVTAQ